MALVVAGVCSVQFGNAAAASFFSQASPMGAVSLRLVFSALILLAIFRPRVGAWTLRTWAGAVMLGAGLGGMNALIYLAVDRIPLGAAVTIELLGPLAVAAAGTRRLLDVLWVLLAVGGILLLGIDSGGADSGGGLNLAGGLLAAGAACCWALYIVASSRLGPRVRGVDGLVMAMCFAALIVAPFGASAAVEAVRAEPNLLWIFAAVALLTSVIPYTLEFTALKRMSSRVFGVLSSLSPAVAAVAGLIVLGQTLTIMESGAIALVVVASIGVVASAGRS